MKDRIAALQDRKELLLQQLEAANEPPPAPAPEHVRLYRAKVIQLADALERPDTRSEATENASRAHR